MFNPHSSLDRSFVIRRLDTAGGRSALQVPPAVSGFNCFLYLDEGELLVDLGDEPVLVLPAHFLLIPPGLRFSIKYHNGSKGYMGAFANHVLKSSHFGILHRYAPVLAGIPEEDRSFFSGLAGKLFREFSSMNTGGGMVPALLDLMLEQVEALSSREPEHTMNALCSDFLDKVFDRSSDILSVSGYAAALSVSPNHLNRVVKKETGRSAGDWIDISRITLAKMLLRQTDMPVIDIAVRVGLDDQSYFTRFFRKHEGVTPSGFRSGMRRQSE